MAIFIPKKTDYIQTTIKDTPKRLIKQGVYESFDTSLLGVGDLSTPSKSIESLCAVFDLQGFTHFCSQIEPHLSVPVFLNSFVDWLMFQIRDEMKKEAHPEGIELWCPLPFYVKYLGDGLLVVWDITNTKNTIARNIIVSCTIICNNYKRKFFPEISKKVVDPPPILRCGIARGTVLSVGNGNDYIGSCINMAARLQKLPGITFAFNRRGIILEGEKISASLANEIVTKKVSIRGIGEGELVCIKKVEYNLLKAKDKKFYVDV